MTSNLLIIAAAFVTFSARVVRPYGEGPAYYGGGSSRERGYDRGDGGDRDHRGGHEGQEYGDERYRD